MMRIPEVEEIIPSMKIGSNRDKGLVSIPHEAVGTFLQTLGFIDKTDHKLTFVFYGLLKNGRVKIMHTKTYPIMNEDKEEALEERMQETFCKEGMCLLEHIFCFLYARELWGFKLHSVLNEKLLRLIMSLASLCEMERTMCCFAALALWDLLDHKSYIAHALNNASSIFYNYLLDEKGNVKTVVSYAVAINIRIWEIERKENDTERVAKLGALHARLHKSLGNMSLIYNPKNKNAIKLAKQILHCLNEYHDKVISFNGFLIECQELVHKFEQAF